MINPLELQPGNWLNYEKDNQWCRFSACVPSSINQVIVEDYKSTRQCSIEDIFPIQLTPSLFTSCGFAMNGQQWGKTAENGLYLTLDFRGSIAHLNIPGRDARSILVEYVHQLQNRYSEIAGEQLPTTLWGHLCNN